jgi:hypothetical protein
VLPDGSVVCRLRIRVGGEWITKTDVGRRASSPTRATAARPPFSDALKRAAVKFGVGRYLYRLPQQWVDYDPQKRQFTRTPTLPPSALPPKEEPTRPAPAASAPGAPPAGEPVPNVAPHQVGALKALAERKGVPLAKILARYQVTAVETLKVPQWEAACGKLTQMPDVQPATPQPEAT